MVCEAKQSETIAVIRRDEVIYTFLSRLTRTQLPKVNVLGVIEVKSMVTLISQEPV